MSKRLFMLPGFTRRPYVRCEDCDLRGDLDALGRIRNPIGVHKCETCAQIIKHGRRKGQMQGTGYIPLEGLDQIDPYALKK